MVLKNISLRLHCRKDVKISDFLISWQRNWKGFLLVYAKWVKLALYGYFRAFFGVLLGGQKIWLPVKKFDHWSKILTQ